MTALTCDSISLRGAGTVTIVQQKKGHRFTLDSLLLADFCRVKPPVRILEPGAGTGIISILLAKKFPKALFSLVEMQPDLVTLCRQNVRLNDLSQSIAVIHREISLLKGLMMPGSFDAIVVNPPYTRSGTGEKCLAKTRQAARHEQTADLGKWIGLQHYLKNKGRYSIVFPVSRLVELVTEMRMRKLEPKRLRLVHPSVDKPASLVMIEAVKSAGPGLEVLSPLIVHEADGRYTGEMRNIYDLQNSPF